MTDELKSVIHAGEALGKQELHEKVDHGARTLAAYQKAKETAFTIKDPDERSQYICEHLESLSMNDLILVASAVGAGLC